VTGVRENEEERRNEHEVHEWKGAAESGTLGCLRDSGGGWRHRILPRSMKMLSINGTGFLEIQNAAL
jgi:hypothetical protein